MQPGLIIGVALLLMAIIALVLRGASRSTNDGGWTVVRCSQGHLFETIWVPLMSFKAVRLGPVRYQRCPVGGHWALVRRVNPADLSPEELEAARSVRDTSLP